MFAALIVQHMKIPSSRTTLPVLHIPRGSVRLRDNDQWQNRFHIQSATSNYLYVISQNRTRRHWGCSCPAWVTRRRCKHLRAIGLPCNEIPHEVQLKEPE